MSPIVSIPLSSTISYMFPKFNINFYPEFFNDTKKLIHANTIKLANDIISDLKLGTINSIEDIEKKMQENILLNIYIFTSINLCTSLP